MEINTNRATFVLSTIAGSASIACAFAAATAASTALTVAAVAGVILFGAASFAFISAWLATADIKDLNGYFSNAKDHFGKFFVGIIQILVTSVIQALIQGIAQGIGQNVRRKIGGLTLL